MHHTINKHQHHTDSPMMTLPFLTTEGSIFTQNMMIDTGSGVSIMSKSKYHELVNDLPSLQPTGVTLATYGGRSLPVLGVISVGVLLNKNTYQLPLYIVDNEGPCLLGMQWLN